jgi:hypothetical protein
MAIDPTNPSGNQAVVGFPFGIPVMLLPTADQWKAAADALPKLQLTFLKATQEILHGLTEITRDQIEATQKTVANSSAPRGTVPPPTNSGSRSTGTGSSG